MKFLLCIIVIALYVQQHEGVRKRRRDAESSQNWLNHGKRTRHHKRVTINRNAAKRQLVPNYLRGGNNEYVDGSLSSNYPSVPREIHDTEYYSPTIAQDKQALGGLIQLLTDDDVDLTEHEDVTSEEVNGGSASNQAMFYSDEFNKFNKVAVDPLDQHNRMEGDIGKEYSLNIEDTVAAEGEQHSIFTNLQPSADEKGAASALLLKSMSQPQLIMNILNKFGFVRPYESEDGNEDHIDSRATFSNPIQISRKGINGHVDLGGAVGFHVNIVGENSTTRSKLNQNQTKSAGNKSNDEMWIFMMNPNHKKDVNKTNQENLTSSFGMLDSMRNKPSSNNSKPLVSNQTFMYSNGSHKFIMNVPVIDLNLYVGASKHRADNIRVSPYEKHPKQSNETKFYGEKRTDQYINKTRYSGPRLYVLDEGPALSKLKTRIMKKPPTGFIDRKTNCEHLNKSVHDVKNFDNTTGLENTECISRSTMDNTEHNGTSDIEVTLENKTVPLRDSGMRQRIRNLLGQLKSSLFNEEAEKDIKKFQDINPYLNNTRKGDKILFLVFNVLAPSNNTEMKRKLINDTINSKISKNLTKSDEMNINAHEDNQMNNTNQNDQGVENRKDIGNMSTDSDGMTSSSFNHSQERLSNSVNSNDESRSNGKIQTTGTSRNLIDANNSISDDTDMAMPQSEEQSLLAAIPKGELKRKAHFLSNFLKNRYNTTEWDDAIEGVIMGTLSHFKAQKNETILGSIQSETEPNHDNAIIQGHYLAHPQSSKMHTLRSSTGPIIENVINDTMDAQQEFPETHQVKSTSISNNTNAVGNIPNGKLSMLKNVTDQDMFEMENDLAVDIPSKVATRLNKVPKLNLLTYRSHTGTKGNKKKDASRDELLQDLKNISSNENENSACDHTQENNDTLRKRCSVPHAIDNTAENEGAESFTETLRDSFSKMKHILADNDKMLNVSDGEKILNGAIEATTKLQEVKSNDDDGYGTIHNIVVRKNNGKTKKTNNTDNMMNKVPFNATKSSILESVNNLVNTLNTTIMEFKSNVSKIRANQQINVKTYGKNHASKLFGDSKNNHVTKYSEEKTSSKIAPKTGNPSKETSSNSSKSLRNVLKLNQALLKFVNKAHVKEVDLQSNNMKTAKSILKLMNKYYADIYGNNTNDNKKEAHGEKSGNHSKTSNKTREGMIPKVEAASDAKMPNISRIGSKSAKQRVDLTSMDVHRLQALNGKEFENSATDDSIKIYNKAARSKKLQNRTEVDNDDNEKDTDVPETYPVGKRHKPMENDTNSEEVLNHSDSVDSVDELHNQSSLAEEETNRQKQDSIHNLTSAKGDNLANNSTPDNEKGAENMKVGNNSIGSGVNSLSNSTKDKVLRKFFAATKPYWKSQQHNASNQSNTEDPDPPLDISMNQLYSEMKKLVDEEEKGSYKMNTESRDLNNSGSDDIHNADGNGGLSNGTYSANSNEDRIAVNNTETKQGMSKDSMSSILSNPDKIVIIVNDNEKAIEDIKHSKDKEER